jgi:hypothetical protein
MLYSTQGTAGRGTLDSLEWRGLFFRAPDFEELSDSASELSSVPASAPVVGSKDDSPRRSVGRPSGNKGMLVLHARPGHGAVGKPFGYAGTAACSRQLCSPAPATVRWESLVVCTDLKRKGERTPLYFTTTHWSSKKCGNRASPLRFDSERPKKERFMSRRQVIPRDCG